MLNGLDVWTSGLDETGGEWSGCRSHRQNTEMAADNSRKCFLTVWQQQDDWLTEIVIDLANQLTEYILERWGT